jgi:hypothetical protein
LDETAVGSYVFGAAQVVVPNTSLNGPSQLTVDGAGNLYVANSTNGTVVEFNTNSVPDPTVFTLNHACTLTGVDPQGVAVDANGFEYAGANGMTGGLPYEVLQVAPCVAVSPTPTLTPTKTPSSTDTQTFTITPGNATSTPTPSFTVTNTPTPVPPT